MGIIQVAQQAWSKVWEGLKYLFHLQYAPEGLLTLGLVVGILIAPSGFSRWANARAARWVQDFTSAESSDETVKGSFSTANTANAAEQVRIESQFQQIRQRAKHHLEVMIDFYGWYYMSIVLTSWMGAFAAIALFWITKDGWSKASSYQIILFVVMTAAALFFSAFPKMFRQEENIADNKQLYLQYVALENEIRSYCVTGETAAGDKKTPATFIHYLDDRMNKTNNIALGFDSTAVPKYDALEAAKGQKAAGPQ
jgi:hypothetical protein